MITNSTNDIGVDELSVTVILLEALTDGAGQNAIVGTENSCCEHYIISLLL